MKIESIDFGLEKDFIKEGFEIVRNDYPRFVMLALSLIALIILIRSELGNKAMLAEANMPLIQAGESCRNQAVNYMINRPSCEVKIGSIVLVNSRSGLPNVSMKALPFPGANPPQ